MKKLNENELREIWKHEEEIAHIKGWDFSYLDGRYDEENDLPWDYAELIHQYVTDDMKIMDYDTGGGEFLLSPRKSLLVVNESWETDCDYDHLVRERIIPEDAGEFLQGFSLKNVTLTLYDKEKRQVYRELGELMFTHFGVTGPLVLSASAHMHDAACAPYKISIDLKPGLNEARLDARILRDFEAYRNRDFANALGDLAGRTMIPVLIRRSGIPPDTKVHSITRAQRLSLVHLFKDFTLSVTGTRPIEEAIVTSGGVSVLEVDPRSMASRLVPGLYFAGEILDVDAYTGGFNLQIAWSTGRLAGEHI